MVRYNDLSCVTFVPSSVTGIGLLFASTNASTGSVAVVVSGLPFAPTFSTPTDAPPPADQPSLLRNRSSASSVMNSKMMTLDYAPICGAVEEVLMRKRFNARA